MAEGRRFYTTEAAAKTLAVSDSRVRQLSRRKNNGERRGSAAVAGKEVQGSNHAVENKENPQEALRSVALR